MQVIVVNLTLFYGSGFVRWSEKQQRRAWIGDLFKDMSKQAKLHHWVAIL